MKGDHLGEFEELVLLAVYGQDGEAYGVSLQEKLAEMLRRSISIGAVYATLERLERKGHVRSWTGGATKERGGRRKRFCEITFSGKAILKQVRRVRDEAWREIEA